jgi:hypothetical protein
MNIFRRAVFYKPERAGSPLQLRSPRNGYRLALQQVFGCARYHPERIFADLFGKCQFHPTLCLGGQAGMMRRPLLAILFALNGLWIKANELGHEAAERVRELADRHAVRTSEP